MNKFEKILLGGKWSEQRSSSWAIQTAKGKWPYIIKYGVCYWGGFLFHIHALYLFIFNLWACNLASWL